MDNVKEKLKNIFQEKKTIGLTVILILALIVSLMTYGKNKSNVFKDEYMNNIFIDENDNSGDNQNNNSDDESEIFEGDSSLIVNNANINGQKENLIVVEIKGEVINPDVYTLNEGSIIKDLIEVAGGLTDQADISNINRAKEINNHELVIIRNINDLVSDEEIEINVMQEVESDDSKININTADLSKLKDIPGIGDVKANSIIMYREENGGFKTIEELKNVDGIGEKTFEKIKDNIKI
ncbi:helix-hairpin-helix domain-containing protein [Clostridium sp. 1001271B_151109_B4]|uniref:helix-hairpin-helix domain-containing protein n=1 Tax=Clostridium sp. 1001271B_151109_B4 TaxID=2787148 RepID=UPI0018AA7AC5|nr:helix-hairpin-helix domain-containing protein [Clostridium sp. 1001271B_151109_B4]